MISKRLTYTKFAQRDFAEYLSWYSNDEVMRYLTGKGLTEEEATARFAKALETNAMHADLGLFAVWIKDINEFMGIGKLSLLSDTQAEIGYGSLPQYWGKGFATEMLERLTTLAKDIHDIKELIAVVHPENQLSKKILLRHSFELYENRMDVHGPVEHYRLEINR